jgi:predicted DNA binding CopG/RHH family protein
MVRHKVDVICWSFGPSIIEKPTSYGQRFNKKRETILSKDQTMKTPKFKNLKDEREFWDDHDSTDFLDDFTLTKDVVFARPQKEVISLRLDPKIIRKLRELADKEGLPRTTYARMLIIKGLRAQVG